MISPSIRSRLDAALNASKRLLLALRTAIHDRFIESISKRIPPGSVPLVGPRTRTVDFVLVHFTIPGGNEDFLGLTFQAQGATGYLFDRTTNERHEVSIPHAVLRDSVVRIEDRFKSSHTMLKSRLGYLLGRSVRRAKLVYVKDRLLLSLYKKRTVRRRVRLQVLEAIAEKSFEKWDFEISALGVVEILHGRTALYSAKAMKASEYYEFILRSFAQSGDLVRQENGRFRLAPQALTTLSSAFEADRRHNDSIRQQRLIGGLTILLVVIGAAQAGVALLTAKDISKNLNDLLAWYQSLPAIF